MKKQMEIDLDYPKKVFAPLFELTAADRTKLNSLLLQLMSVPRDMVVLSDLLDDVGRGKQLQFKMDDLKGKFLSSDDSWTEILTFAGFQVKDGHLSHSDKPSTMFHAIEEYFDAASMLDDDMFDLIKQFSPQTADAMLTVLYKGIKGKDVSDPVTVQACLGDSTCIKILLDLQYSIQGEMLKAPEHLVYIIDEVYWVIYALYGNDKNRQ
ncbi:uncharacterized protein LOC132713098 [Ruditapes philippinarum]|uniref:uncharacterized protein LOC132713098 n=1 Tax=Ruditapes philippinarum TaxID=129788 RepID=UPI00295ADCA1|nr:uncharacterized protein LOC132713098 [Ruditapes philippinarum]